MKKLTGITTVQMRELSETLKSSKIERFALEFGEAYDVPDTTLVRLGNVLSVWLDKIEEKT